MQTQDDDQTLQQHQETKDVNDAYQEMQHLLEKEHLEREQLINLKREEINEIKRKQMDAQKQQEEEELPALFPTQLESNLDDIHGSQTSTTTDLMTLLSNDTDLMIVDHDTHTTISIHETIFDFSCSREERLNALHEYYQAYPEQIINLFNKLCSMYFISPIHSIASFLNDIALDSPLPYTLRLEASLNLCQVDKTRQQGFDILHTLCADTSAFETISYNCQYKYLIDLINERVDSLPLFEQFIHNERIDIAFRYKSILSLRHCIHTHGLDVMTRMCFAFITTQNIEYRILAIQNLLYQCPISLEERTHCFEHLYTLAQDSTIDENRRADAVDLLLHTGMDEYITAATALLEELQGDHVFTMYDNAQNTHMYSVEQHTIDTICQLEQMHLSSVYDKVKEHVMIFANTKYDHDALRRIEQALQRIDMDQTILQHVNHTLRSLITMVFAYIEFKSSTDTDGSYDHQEMMTRLTEELMDMAGTCTSGYASRIVNVLSGYGFSLRISWEEQIRGCVHARLNARISNDPECDLLLEQLLNPTIQSKPEFTRFFRTHIASIQEELRLEFKDHILYEHDYSHVPATSQDVLKMEEARIHDALTRSDMMTRSEWDCYIQRAIAEYNF